ncbi:hypothetical protein E2K80_02420 [Rhodophyticola sp. CCM32]|uniref:DUF6778 family protein n=1 Tax=Rhodophyticola sp. CCM32 TaxID=2916397 RepID=UPI00107EF4A4|nr:DUF6778 family protein [Rhodophyticola sp. CCM32]QBX99716.1 hypothetical protein E2K80_02420 [Rhodophyticola sp. CCM32]
MTRLISLALLGMALAVSACSTPGAVSRNAPLDLAPEQAVQSAQPALPAQSWHVTALHVDVPETLTVSEANTIKPRADIVWREDPLGNRHQQVANVMTPPLEEAFARLDGPVPVEIQLTVTRFHALTDRTRYAFRGKHEIEFDLLIRDAESGALLHGPEHVDLTFDALGGAEAIAAERQGIYQRDRIQTRLSDWLAEAFEGTTPGMQVALAN